MATGNITTTTVDAFIPEIWSKEVILAAVNASTFVNNGLIRQSWDDEVSAMGDVVHIPLFSAVTIGNKVEGTDVTFTNYTETTKDITINKHKYFAFKVSDIAKVQASPDLTSGYTTQGGRGLAKTIDTDLAALIIDSTITQNVGAQTSSDAAYTDITDAVIRDGIQSLDEANAPIEGRHLVISPNQKNAMLGIDKFVRDDAIGAGNNPIRSGYIGEIYGVMVWVNNNLSAVASVASVASSGGASVVNLEPAHHACMLFQEEAFGLVTQLNARVQGQYIVKSLATEVVGDVLYGTGVLQPTYAVQVMTTSE